MPGPYLLSSSALVDADPATAYDTLLAAPLEELFTKRSGPLPPIARSEGQEGEWGSVVGQTRTIVLQDGSTSRETLVQADRDRLDYRYRVEDLRGPFRLLVRHIDGRFEFVPEAGGSRVTWSWALHPASVVARPVLPVFAHFWRGWAAAMWPQLQARLPGAAPR